MYILKIIPIATGLPQNHFSYFSKEKLSLGALTEVKVGNRKVFGLVAERNKVENEKLNLKTQKFALKKIERVVKENFIAENLFQSLLEAATLFGVKESEIIKNYIPEFVFENIDIFAENKLREKEVKKDKNRRLAFIKNFNKRHLEYLNLIKNNFEQKESSVIFFPTISDLKESKKYFEAKNIENILVFHSRQTKKEIKETLKKIDNTEEEEFKESILILSTPSLFPFLISNKINLKTVILEKENSYNYFTHSAKKQVDFREITKKIAEDLGLNIVLGGNILSLKSFRDFENTLSAEKEKNKIFKIIDLVKEKELQKEELEKRTKKIANKKVIKYSSVYFGKELIENLEKIKKENGKAFLYAKRKGLYTETACSDCNTILKCKTCDKPLILFKKDSSENSERFYICPHCKEKIELKKTEDLICENCGSWKLTPLGVGTQGIEENLMDIGFKTFVLDSESVKSKKKVLEILEAWQKEKKTVLIGTDLALNFLNKDFEIDLASIISLDSLFSIPEINIDEKIFNICLEMSEKIKTKEKILIQTRSVEQSIWDFVEKKDTLGFLRDELKTRKSFNLPPYSNILKFKLNVKEIKFKNNLEKILERIWGEEIQNIAHQKILLQEPLQSFGQNEGEKSFNTAHPQPLPQGKGLSLGYRTADTKNYTALQMQSLNLRENQTLAEETLWKELKGNKLGEHFRRQHVVSGFIVDFICLKKNLVIEIDGEIHEKQKWRDEERDKILNNFNLRVIRFTNKEVLENLSEVLEAIKLHLNQVGSEVLPLGKDLGWASKPKISWRIEKKTGNYIGTLTIPENIWQIKKEGKNFPSSFAKKVVTLLSDFHLEINPPNIY